MRFNIFKVILVLLSISILILVPTTAVKLAVDTGDRSRAASVSGEYRLQDSSFLDSSITLGNGALSRQSSAGGSGENMVKEGVTSNSNSVTNTINSDGSFSTASNDFAYVAYGSGAFSDYEASLVGSSGSISTTSTGHQNQMTVAGGFSGKGNMDAALSSMAAQEGFTTGTASALKTPIFGDDLAQGIRGKDLAVSVQGLYKVGENALGDFGMVAQNAKGGAAPKPQPSPANYKLTGWMWMNRKPILLSEDDLTKDGYNLDTVKTEISSAQTTWNGVEGLSKTLLSLDTITQTPDNTYNQDLSKWGVSDGKNVHLWISGFEAGSDTLAMTVTWYSRAKFLLGADGRRYSEAVESDCWYNDQFNWRADNQANLGTGAYSGSFDIQTIALHEHGHTLGLDDLYEDGNSDQTMYGYNDGTSDWTLDSGDNVGIKKLYGP